MLRKVTAASERDRDGAANLPEGCKRPAALLDHRRTRPCCIPDIITGDARHGGKLALVDINFDPGTDPAIVRADYGDDCVLLLVTRRFVEDTWVMPF
jgi:hypothetical protein